MRNAMPPARHPVVRTVRESGRTVAVSRRARHAHRRLAAGRKRPLHRRDQRAHRASREFRYVHEWRVGDLLVWDNRCTLHRATKYDMFQHKRDLRRATINEYGPEVSSTTALGIPPPKVDIAKPF